MAAIYYGISSQPSAGGHHVNAEHVQTLRKIGIRAYLLYWPARGTVDRFESLASIVLYHRNMIFNQDDIVVLPEGWRVPIEYFGRLPCKKVLHCQNPFYVFNGVEKVSEYQSKGILHAITCSSMTKDRLIYLGYTSEIHIVRPKLRHEFIENADASLVRRMQIAYMPRKLPLESSYVRGLFKTLYPEFSKIPWVEINGKSHKECAIIMRESTVFATFGHLEGLGLPPLEAMASGCVVAGFHGYGGKEYATEANGYWVDSGDYEGCAHAIAAAVRATHADDHMQILKREMAKTVKEYDSENFEVSLVKAWNNILGVNHDRFLLDPN